jgi:hypothetical protein
MSAVEPKQPAKPGVKDLKEFFGYAKLADFSREWKELTDDDREQLRTGIADGTFNY